MVGWQGFQDSVLVWFPLIASFPEAGGEMCQVESDMWKWKSKRITWLKSCHSLVWKLCLSHLLYIDSDSRSFI